MWVINWRYCTLMLSVKEGEGQREQKDRMYMY